MAVAERSASLRMGQVACAGVERRPRQAWGRLLACMLIAVSTLAAWPIAAQTPAPRSTRIERTLDVRLGYLNVVKPGYWIPIAVNIKSDNADFQGVMKLSTTDSDDLNTTIYVPDVYVARDTNATVYHVVKPGSASAAVRVDLIDKDGQVAASREVELTDPGLRFEVLDPSESLILTSGSPAGLFEAASGSTEEKLITNSITRTRTLPPEDWPTQWFAYQCVDTFVLTTREATAFDKLDTLRSSALQTWVRQGGHLVVSVANNWQVASNSFLGPMLPAKLTGLGRVKAPEALESFATDANERMAVGEQGLPIATLSDVHGQTLIEADGVPLAVTGAYGLGKVTLLAFDTDTQPFSTWKGRRGFWTKLLALPTTDVSDDPNNPQMGRVANFGVTDLASVMHQHLENFPDVKVVPFGWVAMLIFGYILLIGPIDYFFLKKVVGRLELTWITFPMWVILISVAAYLAAHWLKGDDLRVNRIEVVDIDVDSNTLRGNSYLSIFSPRIAKYSVSMEPGLGAAGSWSELGMGREQTDRVTSWLGLPEYAVRGMYNQGGVGLLGRRGYEYTSPEPTAVVNVPIEVWSVKTFANRWLAAAGPVVQSDLKSEDFVLTGTISNQLDVPLTDVLIVYGDRAYETQRLAAKGEPGSTLDLSATTARSLNSFLGDVRDAGEFDYTGQKELSEGDLDQLMRALLFESRIPAKSRKFPSYYLRDLDLSGLLDLGKVIVLARVPTPGGQLWLNELPGAASQPPEIAGVVKTDTYLRLIIEPTKESP